MSKYPIPTSIPFLFRFTNATLANSATASVIFDGGILVAGASWFKGGATVFASSPNLYIRDESGGVNAHDWDITATGNMLLIRADNDAHNNVSNFLVVTRSGFSVTGATFYCPIIFTKPFQVQAKAFTANGATTTFTYPANTQYQYITTSAASLATTLPATSAALDGMVITLVAGSSVATATWVAGTGGATIVGAPAALVANTPVRMIYHHATTSWYPY